MSLITTLDHAYAAAAQDVVSAAKFIEGKVLPVLQKANTAATTVEAVTGLVSSQAVNIERTAFAVLGAIIKAVDAAGSAVAAGGLNVPLDATLIADVKAIMSAVKSQAAPVTTSSAAIATKS